jgi:hypothetical protein
MINKQKTIIIRSDAQIFFDKRSDAHIKTQAIKQMDITIRFNNIAIII